MSYTFLQIFNKVIFFESLSELTDKEKFNIIIKLMENGETGNKLKDSFYKEVKKTYDDKRLKELKIERSMTTRQYKPDDHIDKEKIKLLSGF